MGTLTTKFKLPGSESNFQPIDRELTAVRVKDIILDDSHPEYDKFGKEQSIGLIKYTSLDTKQDTSDSKNLPYAFPLNVFSITYPLINEVVLLVKSPREDRNLEKVEYYQTIVGLYNDVNYIPSIDANEKDESPGYEFVENTTIKPLHPFHGDTLIQGRNGQSIRLTGARSPKNPYSNKTNANQPLTSIVNGYGEVGTDGTYVEDINKDLSSLYLTSNHVLPLKQARDKYAAAKSRPLKADTYKGNQIILNSGRLYFNATTEDIQFSANGNFNVSSNTIGLDAVEYVGLDASKIYLGEKAVRFELEPVILGNQLELFLDVLLNELLRVANSFKKAKTIDGKIIPTIVSEGFTLESVIKTLQNRINPNGDSILKSKKVYTE